MNLKKTATAVGLLLMGAAESHAQLIINEIMQSNIDCVMDDLNDFPDSWVELYNSGSSAVSLNNYKLGKSSEASEAWQLPNQSVGAKQYILVYCDKEATGLHTDFRLESGKGCEVYLFQNGTVADQISGLKKQPAPNIAYGRQTDGAAKWGYQQQPTPKAANCGILCEKILGNPVFSVPGGVYTSQQTVTVALSVPEGTPTTAEIHYTTDGSEPTRTSSLYTVPFNISSTRTIRAKLFCDSYLSPRSTTQSYIFHGRTQTLPVISIVTDNRYLNDSKIGIYVDGNYDSQKKNYEYDWRRPINFEFFDESGQSSQLNQLCETRIQGGASRGSKFKSLAVYANKRFGTKRLEYEFFPDQRPGVTDFKSIILRNAGNDFDYLYMRDAIIQRTMSSHCDLDWQAWRPAIIYINGTYSGILNIRERSNEDNVYTHYDGLEDIDMIENWNELKEGDWDNYNQFKTFYTEHGHTLAEYEQWIDWQEYLNLMIMNLYYNNQDFPGNNFIMWRPRTGNGRWRFIAKDTDFGLGLYGTSSSYKTIEWIYNPNYDSGHAWANGYDHTRLFRRMMEDEDFKREFIDRTAIYMGDFMNAKGTRAVWDPMYDLIKTEYPYHRKLINQWWPNYNDELNNARNWVSTRTASFYQQLADYYHLGTPTVLAVNKEVNAEELAAVAITFNGIKLTEGTFDGKFFANRTVTLSGSPVNGKQVTGWNIRQVGTNGTVTTAQAQGASYSFYMPTCNNLAINAILGEADGIDDIAARSWTWTVNDRQLSLQGVADQTPVRLYDMSGIQLWQGRPTDGNVTIPLGRGRFYLLKVGDKTTKLAL